MLPDGLRVVPFDDTRHDAVVTFENRFLPASQQWKTERSKRFDREHPAPEKLRVLLVDADDAIVGTAFARSAEIVGKANGAFTLFARVDPRWQRRGIGGRLFDDMERHAMAHRAPRLLTITYGNEAGGLAFLAKRGYREYSRRTRWSLRLAAFEPLRYTTPIEIAAEAGVEILDLATAMTDGHVSDVTRQLYDAHREILEELPLPLRPNWPELEKYKEQLDDPEIDREASAVAVRDGRVVGLTVVALLDNGIASSIVTGAIREGRGKRLGLALKLHALRVLKDRGRELVATINDADNAPTLRILKTLGYEPEPAIIRFERRLAPS